MAPVVCVWQANNMGKPVYHSLLVGMVWCLLSSAQVQAEPAGNKNATMLLPAASTEQDVEQTKQDGHEDLDKDLGSDVDNDRTDQKTQQQDQGTNTTTGSAKKDQEETPEGPVTKIGYEEIPEDMVRTMNVAPDQVPDSKKIAVAGLLLQRMSENLQRVQDLLDQAEKEKDKVKRNCLGPKLDGINEATAAASTAFGAMRIAIGSRDATTADKEYQIIYEASLKCDQAATESQSCMGAVYSGKTQVSADVDTKRLPTVNPAAVPHLLGKSEVAKLNRPVCGSCYK